MSPEQKNKQLAQQEDLALQLDHYHRKIANILESFTDAYFEVDHHWNVIYWNAEAERLLNVSREDILGKNLWNEYQEALPLKFFTEYHKAVLDHVAVRFEEYFPPKNLWVEVAAFPTGEGLSVYFKDITEVKRSAQALEDERKKYHNLFNLSPLPQFVYDLQTLEILQVNQAAIDHYGYSHEEFLHMTVEDMHPTEKLASLREILKTKIKVGQYVQTFSEHQKKNGELISVQIEGNSVYFEGKNARLALVIDLTDKIVAEKELKQTLNRYNIVSKATSDAIWDWDIIIGSVNWNNGIEAIFGHSNVGFTYQWWQEHVHPDDLERVNQQFDKLLNKQESRHQIEYKFLCADGSYKNILDRAFIMFDEMGQAVRVIGSMQDITERIRNSHAIEAQNMRFREISWIQAHEVRAPVAKILSLSELLCLNPLPSLPEMLELADLIHSSATDLDRIIKVIIEKSK